MRPAVALCAVFSLSVVQSCSAIALKLDGNGRFNKSLISISNKVPFRSQVVSNLKNGFWTVKSSPSALSSIIRRRRSTGSSGYFFTISSNKPIVLKLRPVWHLMGGRALNIQNMENDKEHPLRVTASFTQDGNFIKVPANCTATVYDDDTIYFKDYPLKDDGIDPDYAADDGYYTSLLPPIFFKQQWYKLVVLCTGDKVYRSYAVFRITGVNPNTNALIPPSRVEDFAIHHDYSGNSTARMTLTFTAVGAHQMNGTASRYIFTLCSTGKTTPPCYERLLPSSHVVAARNPVRFEIPNEWKFLFNDTFRIQIAAENNYWQRSPLSHHLIAQLVEIKPDSQGPVNNYQPKTPSNTSSNQSTSQSTTQTQANPPSNMATKKFRASRNLPRVLFLVWTAWVLG